MIAPAAVPLSVSYLTALAIGKRSRGAAIGLLFYDYMISFGQEVELVWTKDKRHPVLYLYLFNRWFAFIYYLWDTIPLTTSGIVASEICVIYLMLDALVTLIATVLVQILLQLRIYALYERNKKILALMFALTVMEVSIMAVLVGITVSRLDRIPIISTPTGCAYEGLLNLYALFWIPGIVVEPVLFALVAYRAWGSTTRIALISRVARGSLIYFVVTFVQLLVNTVIWARYPQYINIFNPWSAALPSLLGSRLFLGTRSLVQKQGGRSYIYETYALSSSEHMGHELTETFHSTTTP